MLLYIVVTLCFSTVLGAVKSPVVFIPGDGGNQIDAKLNKSDVVHYICEKTSSDYFTLWLAIGEFIEVIIDCWVDNAKLTYNVTSRTTSNQPGVDIRVPGWGDTFTVEWLDPLKLPTGAYFKDIGNALVDLGYVRNVSLRGAPFDFRKAPNELGEYFSNLKALVEETYEMNNHSRVVLVAHSMGAPMSHYFLTRQSQEWKDQYVESLVTLSGAWGGSFKSLKVFYMGDDLGVYILPGGTLKEMEKTMPSIAWLLPWPQLWKPDEVLIQTPDKNYSLSNLQEFFMDINYTTGWEMTKDQSKYWDFTSPGVDLYCLHGGDISTPEKMVFKEGVFPTGKPDFVNGDGDGTVNARSLEACNLWKDSKDTKVTYRRYSGIDHQGMLHNQDVVNYVVDLVTGSNRTANTGS